ncbi:MAG: U32 family peptidase [Candidatus Magasanikbacteria bacterium]
MTRQIEIMAPAGSPASLTAALDAGANSVYFGVDRLNMRSQGATNFPIEELPDLAKRCSEKKVKTYLTLNVVLYDNDLDEMKVICDAAKDAGVSAVIAADIAAIQYASSIGLEVHISTQANVSNIEAVRFYAKFADVVVLARELTIDQIQDICDTIKNEKITGPSGELLRIELFVHGALCVSISGKCYMSLARYNCSANRGKCLQVCRRAYRVIDEETGDELVVDNKFIMSPKDLCCVKFLDKILDTGVSVLKLEGRGRSADYVHTVTRVYREAADACLADDFSEEKAEGWVKELESVFNRGFWHGGYYLGKKLGEWAGEYGSQATIKKEMIGRFQKYFAKVKIGEFKIETGELKLGDEIAVIGPTTGYIKKKVETMRVEDKEVESAVKGDIVTIPFEVRVRKSDKIFVLREAKN